MRVVNLRSELARIDVPRSAAGNGAGEEHWNGFEIAAGIARDSHPIGDLFAKIFTARVQREFDDGA